VRGVHTLEPTVGPGPLTMPLTSHVAASRPIHHAARAPALSVPLYTPMKPVGQVGRSESREPTPCQLRRRHRNEPVPAPRGGAPAIVSVAW